MKPLVSILIPAYNAEPLLAETVRSALAQTWPRKEIIIVDDGSKDNTVTVARQFEKDDVKVVTQPNQGASAARKRAADGNVSRRATAKGRKRFFMVKKAGRLSRTAARKPARSARRRGGLTPGI